RVSRILRAEVLQERVVIPVDFDLATYWEASAVAFKSNLPTYTARFRVAPEVFPFLRFAGRFSRVGDEHETDADGWIRVSVRFDVEEMACQFALSFGSRLEVLEPETLRMKVIQAAKETVEFYKQATIKA